MENYVKGEGLAVFFRAFQGVDLASVVVSGVLTPYIPHCIMM